MAGVDEILAEAMTRYESMAQQPLADTIVFAVDEPSAMRDLVDTAHSRRSNRP